MIVVEVIMLEIHPFLIYFMLSSLKNEMTSLFFLLSSSEPEQKNIPLIKIKLFK